MREFQAALVRSMGCDPSLLGTAGVSVAGASHRAENKVTAGYAIDEHMFITCDPAVEDRLQAAAVDMEPTLEGWVAMATSLKGELLGSGVMHVLGGNGLVDVDALKPRYQLRSLDTDADRGLVESFIARNSEDDLDEAEVEIDNLDEIIDVVLDDGEIASWASTHAFEMADDHGDIGVLTHPDYRGQGLGRAAVASVCSRIESMGMHPLYRCDTDNTGSLALSRSLGFERATELTAYRFSR